MILKKMHKNETWVGEKTANAMRKTCWYGWELTLEKDSSGRQRVDLKRRGRVKRSNNGTCKINK